MVLYVFIPLQFIVASHKYALKQINKNGHKSLIINSNTKQVHKSKLYRFKENVCFLVEVDSACQIDNKYRRVVHY